MVQEELAELCRKQIAELDKLRNDFAYHKENSVPLVVFGNLYKEMHRWLENYLEAKKRLEEIEGICNDAENTSHLDMVNALTNIRELAKEAE